MNSTNHIELEKWVNEMAQLCQPDKIVWCNGSEREKKQLIQEGNAAGEIVELNQKKLPGCLFHRTHQNDVARTEHLTFICTNKKEAAGPTNNWMSPKEAYEKAKALFNGSMKGRTMYVVPFAMGQIGSKFCKLGVELTDSIYVVLNMRIMTTMGKKVLKALGTNGEFTKCLHSKADLNIERRLILHFPEDNTIWSVGSGYGGNVLLGKKCLALRIASHLGRKEGWMAEHMLIMGIEEPSGKVTYVAAAFPSACGKTNLAMIVPPPVFEKKGYKIWTVGDDIAWLKLDEEGDLRAVNPETGFFGVLPGTNSKTNPNAMATFKKNSIFTNVLLKKDKTVWWEGHDDPSPQEGTNWQGMDWKPGMTDLAGKPVLAAHPNSRFTSPITQCPTLSKEYFDPNGVKISAIIFGGRRNHTAPLVFEARNWPEGVYVGATMASELTAAQMGKLGEVRRDPMAMIPFCGYNMADYFNHWLETGKKMKSPPKIFHVNWFRRDENGKFIWPGYGDNLRVLSWILKRSSGEISAEDSPLGLIPKMEDIDFTGLNLTRETWNKLFDINQSEWEHEMTDRKNFFNKFGSDLPASILEEHTKLQERIFGQTVSV